MVRGLPPKDYKIFLDVINTIRASKWDNLLDILED